MIEFPEYQQAKFSVFVNGDIETPIDPPEPSVAPMQNV